MLLNTTSKNNIINSNNCTYINKSNQILMKGLKKIFLGDNKLLNCNRVLNFNLTIITYIFFHLISSSLIYNVNAASIVEDDLNCGYKACPEISPNKTNVHLICHTHDDVGWVKTADEYFFGGRRGQNYFAVEQILDSVVSELLKNKNRRFVYVESAFLWRWWILKDDLVKNAFKKLVNEGRLQLLGGGWVMSDEATPHYSALIDQMTLGHKFLKDTFGTCNLPKVAWQIDPFGHSSEVALQFAEMGFDGLFISRMDKREYDQRRSEKSLEMIWKPDSRTGPEGELFTGQTFDPLHPYHPPNKLCFDITCTDEPVIDNKIFHGYNIERRANDFIQIVKQWSLPYKTNNVILTMGGDFHYLVASSWYNNLDRLIKYINKNRDDINVFYSTPACYLKALHSTNTNWPVKKDEDFFPYGGTYNEIWTGYYTSRPTFKRQVYEANNLFQACKQLRLPLGQLYEYQQNEMARAMAMVQHHDAVSGTQKQFVADDYRQYLSDGTEACQQIVNATLSKWQEDRLKYEFCQNLNKTACTTTEKSSKFVVTLYNPHAHEINYVVNIPVQLRNYTVTDTKGNEIKFDLIKLPNEVSRISEHIINFNDLHELVFNAEQLPPLGIKSLFVENKPIAIETGTFTGLRDVKTYRMDQSKEDIVVNNKFIQLYFDKQTGLLTKVLRNEEEWEFKQNFLSYAPGGSGAYLFETTDEATPLNKIDSIQVVIGEQVTEVRQVFTQFITQTIRIYSEKDEIEFEWLVGPLPKAMQVITRYSTALTSGSFYTDSNGRRLLKRKRNESIQKSYYPITSAAVLKTDTHRVTVLTDRPQGAASWQDGTIEIMVHRQLQMDDEKGVQEILNELDDKSQGIVVKGKHIIQLSTSSNQKLNGEIIFPDGAKRHRIRAQEILLSPIITFSPAENMVKNTFTRDIRDSYETSMIKNVLPENVHLLTLERWTNDTVLVRLEHIFEVNEEPELSKPTIVKLKELFKNYEVIQAKELTLSATWEKTEVQRLKWKHDNKIQEDVTILPLPDSLEIKLEPMQIRTFEVTLATPPPSESSGLIVIPNIYLYIFLIFNFTIIFM